METSSAESRCDPRTEGNPGGSGGGPGPPDPFGPNGPGPPPEPPGLPSVRGSQRDSADDVSTAAYTAEEVPRMSRREADKVYVSPWPKQQNLGVWQSDLIKSVVLSANDGDKPAWEAWLQPAIRPNPDIELLNDMRATVSINRRQVVNCIVKRDSPSR